MKSEMTLDPVPHLCWIIQRDTKLSRISLLVSGVGVYARLPSKLSIPNSFIKQSVMCRTPKHDIAWSIVCEGQHVSHRGETDVLQSLKMLRKCLFYH